jgi:hypothetical protein
VDREKMVFSIGEHTSNIWVAEWKEPWPAIGQTQGHYRRAFDGRTPVY